MFNDVEVKGQTQGCYGEYMDKMISERYGKKFKSSVMATADSILSVSNDTVDAYSCDTRSHLPNESPEVESEIRCKISKELRNKIGGNSPFLDIRLYVDKLGLPSGYDLWSSNEVKDQYEDELYRNALHLLNAYKTWIPGEIQGRKVNTKTNIRVYFYTE